MTVKSEGKELVITRVLNAPRKLVFKAWSEVEHLKRWWGPKGFEISVAQLDFRPGGFFHYNMQSPDGNQMWGKFVYQEIEAFEKIVWLNSFSDEAGNIVRAPFSDLIPLEIRNAVTFSENNGNTTMTLCSGPFNATEEERSFFEGMFESMHEGFRGTFDQLEEYLSAHS
ncbi:SRPBCC family protein [Paenibacillus radicis (ex Xue et al. 2023)]|uniref:SRPBCC domain-containing protein n=1 Tax=Paenibacillus radicis (ex Xue et al. 2023) TaxID=2972489 RepID=A0ABT1YFL6_9BACL|nr:SRPBCC domain-containing protein [Paenibacillus radicis (ex Xue et al. 2023)]MCR8631998.1 SRPBCC domain-containing protein [Paenibacillus radicis (ex Xue et al. 2023)]